MATILCMRLSSGSWRVLHDAKNELAAAMLLLGRMRAGIAVAPMEVEALLRRTAVRLDEFFEHVEVSPSNPQAQWHRRRPTTRARAGRDKHSVDLPVALR